MKDQEEKEEDKSWIEATENNRLLERSEELKRKSKETTDKLNELKQLANELLKRLSI